jgi:hypothetical protein
MNRTKHLTQLRGIAEWCLSEQDPILTPTGRKKKTPTYWIRECDVHDLSLTSSRMPKADRDTCPAHTAVRGQAVSEQTTQGKPKSPRTVICKRPTELVEEIAR